MRAGYVESRGAMRAGYRLLFKCRLQAEYSTYVLWCPVKFLRFVSKIELTVYIAEIYIAVIAFSPLLLKLKVENALFSSTIPFKYA
jgi:hypothetical protein